NVAFVSTENTNSTNNVSTAYSVSSPSVLKSQKEGSSSYTDEVIHSFFANQSSAPKLDYDDLEQINNDDIKEMDLKWQGILLVTTKLKGTKTLEEDILGSDNKVKSCSKAWEESYARLKKLYDNQRDKLGDASVDITAYTLALKKASDLEDIPVNDRFANGMHAVSPLMTGNYMPSGPDVEIDYSKFTYGSKQTSADESDSKPSEYASYESDSRNKAHLADYQEFKAGSVAFGGSNGRITGNKAHLADYQEFKAGSVAFGGSNGRITGKGKIKTGRLDFEDVYYVEELKHCNLLSVSQMCDKKNKVLFTNIDCLVLSLDFKLPDEN
nr:putative ribonuclease H-like domain-containing protein [Tanacetum cinerariifolium]